CGKRSMRFVSLEWSVLISAARCWSSQKPGPPMASSSSAARAVRRSGSKVITDPGELGPDLLELRVERLLLCLRQGIRLAEGPAVLRAGRKSTRIRHKGVRVAPIASSAGGSGKPPPWVGGGWLGPRETGGPKPPLPRVCAQQ